MAFRSPQLMPAAWRCIIWHKPGGLNAMNVRNKGRACSVNGCNEPAICRLMCVTHYGRYRRTGLTSVKVKQAKKGEPLLFLLLLSNDETDCVMWPFAKGSNGYGVLLFRGAQTTASRVCCEIHHGPPPAPHFQAAHSCGRGHLGCVNPAHLRWMRPLENTGEKEVHGTAPVGERHPSAKITERDVVDIRRRYSRTTRSQLADEFGLRPSHVWAIATGRAWRHVK